MPRYPPFVLAPSPARVSRCRVSPIWRSGHSALGLINRGCDARRTVDQQPPPVKRCRARCAAIAVGARGAAGVLARVPETEAIGVLKAGVEARRHLLLAPALHGGGDAQRLAILG